MSERAVDEAGDRNVQAVGVPYASVIAAVQNACFPDEMWSAPAIAAMMDSPGTFAFLAGGVDAPGFVLARVAGEDAEILALGVSETARRQGLARRLLDAAIREAFARGATAMFLEVAEDNEPARRLYAGAGFQAVGRRPAYYRRRDGRVAAVILRWPAFGVDPAL